MICAAEGADLRRLKIKIPYRKHLVRDFFVSLYCAEMGAKAAQRPATD